MRRKIVKKIDKVAWEPSKFLKENSNTKYDFKKGFASLKSLDIALMTEDIHGLQTNKRTVNSPSKRLKIIEIGTQTLNDDELKVHKACEVNK